MTAVTRREIFTLFAAFFSDPAIRRAFPWIAAPLPLQEALDSPSTENTDIRNNGPVPDHNPPETASYWFTDVSKRSSFSYRTNNGYAGRKYFPIPMCGGVAAIDYDNDGRMDLFFTNGAQLPELAKTSRAFYNCLLRNRGDGTFEDVTAKAGLGGADLGYSFGVAVADYDNDGNEDIFVCNAGRNALYHNNGNGTFTDVTIGSGLDHKPDNVLSVGAAWFDYDNDGLLDLIVTNYTTWTTDSSPVSSLSGPIRHRAHSGSERVRIEARDESTAQEKAETTTKATAKTKTL
ncbi:MAG: VCBS repeat-containing protein, partial [Terriglobales bacterium]